MKGLRLKLEICGNLFMLVIMMSLVEVTEADIELPQDGSLVTAQYQNIDLERIIVTNRRTPVDLKDSFENVEVMSAQDIQALPVRNVSEALRYITGVTIQSGRGFGRATTVAIQGSDPRQVRFMIDGIPLNSQASGQVSPAMFPIENIARIEVMKGAASSVWGSGLGGVINIITKDTGETLIPKGSLTGSFAEFKTRKESFEVSGKVDKVGYYLLSSYMESGGRGPKDDVLEKKGFGKLSYDLKEMGKMVASFGYSQADVNNGEFPDGTWLAQPYRNRYGKVGWEAKFDSIELNVDLKHSRQEVIAKFYDSIADEGPSVRAEFMDRLYQLSLNSSIHPRQGDVLVLGADLDCDTLKSTYLFKAKNVKSQAPYVNYGLKLEPWDFNFGLRYDNNSEYGDQLSPALGAVYKLGQSANTLIRAGVSRAFNAPPLLWKYYEEDLSGLVTNPDIKPERAWVYEAGIESKPFDTCWIKLSLYRADVWDAIALIHNEELDQYYMENFEKFRRQGVELQVRVNLCEGLDLFAAGAFNDVEDRAIRKTVKGVGPRQSFDVGIAYKNKHGFSLSLNGYYDRWNEEVVEYENQLGEPVSVDANDRKMLLDAKISQDFKNFTVFLNAYNLTNSKYWADYFLPMPERYFEGGMKFQW